MEEWNPAVNDFVLRLVAAGEQTKTNIPKLSVLHVKNIIVNSG
jgi:hypothetical protein